MKLKDANKTSKQKTQRIVVIFAVAFLLSIIVETTIRLGFSAIYLLMAGSMVTVAIVAFYLTIDKLNYENKYLKEEGEKVEGKVIGLGEVKEGYFSNNYFIVVSFSNKVKRVQFVESNKAYSVLQMLLDEYPVSEEKEIPIDIYVKKNKFYADLDSVDLSKVKGYEDAVKLVEDMQDDMSY